MYKIGRPGSLCVWTTHLTFKTLGLDFGYRPHWPTTVHLSSKDRPLSSRTVHFCSRPSTMDLTPSTSWNDRPFFGCPRSTKGSFPHVTELLPFSRGKPLISSHWDDLSCHVIWNFIHWNSLLMLTPGLALNNVDFHTSQLIILIYICMLKLTYSDLFTVSLGIYLELGRELVHFSPF